MTTNPSRWGWALLSFGILSVAATWLTESFALLCWGWTIVAMGAAWIALTSMRFGLAQSLLVGAAFMNVGAGVCNGLVMAANGMRMPVEAIERWDRTPSYFGDPSDRGSRFCRMIRDADTAVMPIAGPSTHFDVPRRHVFELFRIVPFVPPPASPPRFAVLDDRHGLRICGAEIAYSKGDALGFIGTVMLGLPGLLLLALGFLWRKIVIGTQRPSAHA